MKPGVQGWSWVLPVLHLLWAGDGVGLLCAGPSFGFWFWSSRGQTSISLAVCVISYTEYFLFLNRSPNSL